MHESSTASRSQERRRRFRFSLRTFLVVATILAIMFGWKINNSRWQAAAVKRIEEVGGRVTYDYEKDSAGNFIPDARPSVPGWLIRLLGIDFFANVTAVVLNDATDQKLALIVPTLEKLPRLKSLSATHSEITDQGAQEIGRLKTLSELWLGGNRQLTGKSLSHFNELPKLRVLEMWRAQITDKDLEKFGARKLERFEISSTRVTDAGLAHLSALPNLKELGLHSNAVTDDGIRALTAHRNLVFLDLGKTQVTDRCIPSLVLFQSLKTLGLNKTKITQTGFQEISGALPKTKITYP